LFPQDTGASPCSPLVWNPVKAPNIRFSSSHFRKEHPCCEKASSLELIPAITVTTDKNTGFEDHSDDDDISNKSHEIINDECILLTNSQNKTSLNKKDDDEDDDDDNDDDDDDDDDDDRTMTHETELIQMNQKLDRIQKDFNEFTKYFIKNENSFNNQSIPLNTSNNNNNNIEKRLKMIHSVAGNDTVSSTQTNIAHSNNNNINNDNNNNSISNNNVKNSKDGLSPSKSIIPTTIMNSRPCLHQYGRTHHYSPENRVVTFQLPPRNYDFRSQSLTSSRQISPETPKSNPIKKLLHKHPSISHDLN
uniref:Myb domain-containing protein n=1 Tax=Schistosoma curassoni TaxID=6186 RepID=A0A183K8A8_9TREM